MRQRILLITLIGFGIGSLIAGLSEIFLSIQHNKLQVQGINQTALYSPSPTPTPTPTLIPKSILSNKKNTKQNPFPTPIPTNTPFSQALQNDSLQNPNPTPIPTNTTPTFQVNFSITGSPNLTVDIPEGSNQCDVLSKALEQGKIQSLNMRYDKNLETYAVYQINGLGKENTVWWVYTVNGQSPSQGCSYIKANSGDNIEWKYIGT